MQSYAEELRIGSDQPQGRERECNLPAPVRETSKEAVMGSGGAGCRGAKEGRQLGPPLSGG